VKTRPGGEDLGTKWGGGNTRMCFGGERTQNPLLVLLQNYGRESTWGGWGGGERFRKRGGTLGRERGTSRSKCHGPPGIIVKSLLKSQKQHMGGRGLWSSKKQKNKGDKKGGQAH